MHGTQKHVLKLVFDAAWGVRVELYCAQVFHNNEEALEAAIEAGEVQVFKKSDGTAWCKHMSHKTGRSDVIKEAHKVIGRDVTLRAWSDIIGFIHPVYIQ